MERDPIKKYRPPEKKGNDWLIIGSVILGMIVITLLLVAVSTLTTPSKPGHTNSYMS